MYENWKVAIIGTGTMGMGIGQIFAANRFYVTLVDQNEALLERAKKMIDGNCDYLMGEKLVDSGYKTRALENLHYITNDHLEQAVADADLIIEAVFESPDVKRDVYEKLSRFCRPDCIFCSNTSGSNVFEIAKVTHPERFLITHWFNPPFIMDLVEIVRGPGTSDEVTESVRRIIAHLGKKPVVIQQYIPGFIVNRLANALMREACYMVDQGWTTPQDIDDAVKAVNGVRYAFEGPFALYDVVGWDLVQSVAVDLFKSLCNDTEGFDLARRMIDEGALGIKSGKGAYDYTGVDTVQYMNDRSSKIVKMYRAIQELSEGADV